MSKPVRYTQRYATMPARCPKCKKPTVRKTPGAYYCNRPTCNWTGGMVPPYGQPGPSPVVERRDY